MLSRYVLGLTLLAGPAFATPDAPHEGLIKGQTTVADVEQSLGAPADTLMRPNGALTLIYAYERCSKVMPAAFPAPAGARTVALRFGADFRYRSNSITNTVASLSSSETSTRTLAAK